MILKDNGVSKLYPLSRGETEELFSNAAEERMRRMQSGFEESEGRLGSERGNNRSTKERVGKGRSYI